MDCWVTPAGLPAAPAGVPLQVRVVAVPWAGESRRCVRTSFTKIKESLVFDLMRIRGVSHNEP